MRNPKRRNTTIVFASANPNKIAEIRAMMPPDITLLGLSDINCLEEIPETSDTIEGNAIQKATYISQHYGFDCFADDTGLEVRALSGAPGVYSARYAGPQKNDVDNMEKLLSDLQGKADRSARFKTVIALSLNGKLELFTGIIEGTITEQRRGESGFGYDPVFLPDGHHQTFAEMNMHQKAKMSHRGIAVRKLISFLETLNNS